MEKRKRALVAPFAQRNTCRRVDGERSRIWRPRATEPVSCRRLGAAAAQDAQQLRADARQPARANCCSRARRRRPQLQSRWPGDARKRPPERRKPSSVDAQRGDGQNRQLLAKRSPFKNISNGKRKQQEQSMCARAAAFWRGLQNAAENLAWSFGRPFVDTIWSIATRCRRPPFPKRQTRKRVPQPQPPPRPPSQRPSPLCNAAR